MSEAKQEPSSLPLQLDRKMSAYGELLWSIVHKYSPLAGDHTKPAPDSQIEIWLNEKLCKPVALRLPVGVIVPNHITIFNVFVASSSFFCALAARTLEDSYGVDCSGKVPVLLLRFAVAILVFGHMFFDSLDGTYARTSKQTSDVGEILDHGFDALNVQLISAGILLTIGFPPWVLALTQVLSSFVYNGQIVLYRVTTKMVNPPTNGVDAETQGILLHLIVAFYIFFFGKNFFWIVFANVAAVFANISQVHDWLFFFKRFPPEDKDFDLHLALVGVAIPFALLLIFNFVPVVVFVFMYGVVCLRCTGVVVVHTVTEKRRSLPRNASAAFNNFHNSLYSWGWGLFFLFSFSSFFPSFKWLGNIALAGFFAHTMYLNYTESVASIMLMPSRQAKKIE
eukprot:TRINITY_DN3272_c0_g1_i1.p1 TRINITY_DN3272_c0_g1~~TRINITY_DN3272_c0_g1_i1.p1  ORF type:complete len:395 (+),score=111.75 TRINITY_DN3272_c0_g1_i1:2291-3475(+)